MQAKLYCFCKSFSRPPGPQNHDVSTSLFLFQFAKQDPVWRTVPELQRPIKIDSYNHKNPISKIPRV